MKDTVEFGINKTGIQMSPDLSQEMISGVEEFPPKALDTSVSAVEFRQKYFDESGSVGSVAAPMEGEALGGAVSAILMDKLGERMAFERSGVRLYDALITKCQAAMPKMSLEQLMLFREEEARHFQIVKEAIEELGGDPTSQTPCADVSAVASMGIIQVLNDPRTSVAQCVQAILIAELADNDGWNLLIQMLREAPGLEHLVERFQSARADEDKHLIYMRHWLKQLTLKEEQEALH